MHQQIKVNQVWIMKVRLHDDTVGRRVRVLAWHPDGGIIFKDEPATLKIDLTQIRSLGYFQFKAVFELEKDVCEHRHTRDGYADKEYPSAMPDLYICKDCGDTFPNTGDTNLWFPKVISNNA